MTLPAWVEEYRGRPFKYGADGPEAFDCYGLIRAVLRDRWGAAVPDVVDIYKLDKRGRLRAALGSEGSPWSAVDGEVAAGDVLVFEDPGPRHEIHVGVVVAPGWMLHTRQGEGVTTARLDRMPWAALRIGSPFRHRAVTRSAPTIGSRHGG